MSTTESYLPTTTVVLALVLSLICLLGLFLLLMKNERQVGFVQVTVEGNGFCHSTTIPVTHPQEVLGINEEVEYARELAG